MFNFRGTLKSIQVKLTSSMKFNEVQPNPERSDSPWMFGSVTAVPDHLRGNSGNGPETGEGDGSRPPMCPPRRAEAKGAVLDLGGRSDVP